MVKSKGHSLLWNLCKTYRPGGGGVSVNDKTNKQKDFCYFSVDEERSHGELCSPAPQNINSATKTGPSLRVVINTSGDDGDKQQMAGNPA